MTNSNDELKFVPFSDDVSQSMLQELTFENQGDAVSIYGSLQITKDAEGLARAKQLAHIVHQAITYLETGNVENNNTDSPSSTENNTDQLKPEEEKPFNWDE